MLVMISALCTVVTLVTTVLACVTDVRTMRIPNLFSVIILAAFVVGYLTSPESFAERWWHYPLSFVVMLAMTGFMFAKGMIGGGDAKIGSALALWVGLKGIVPYVFWMALMGGVLGGLSILIKKSKPMPGLSPENWISQVQAGRNAVPYGIAISAGAWGSLLQSGFIAHQLDEVLKIIH